MARFTNKISQALLTEFTGKPLPGEPSAHHSVLGRVAVNAFAHVALTSGAAYAAARGWGARGALSAAVWVAASLVCMTLAAGAVYAVRGVINHHLFGHGNVRETGVRRVVAENLGRMASVVWVLPAPGPYAKGHRPHHSATASAKDDDFVALLRRGLRPGMSMEWYRRWFRRQTNNVPALLRDMWRDAASHLGRQVTHSHKALFLGTWAVLVALIVAIGAYSLILSALLIRLLAARYSVTQMMSEHTWSRIDPTRTKYEPGLTFHRLVGYPLPDPTGSPLRDGLTVLAWSLKMLSALPVRMGVAAGDLKHHHGHHANAKADWANSAFLEPSGEEVWGNVAEWNEVTFAALHRLPTSHWDALLKAMRV